MGKQLQFLPTIWWSKTHQQLLSCALGPLFGWAFFIGLQSIFKIYTSFWLWQNALAAVVIIFLYLWLIVRNGMRDKTTQNEAFDMFLSLAGIFLTSGAFLINIVLTKLAILTPILTMMSGYFLSYFWLKPKFWRSSFAIYLLLILTLPILERLQRFIGLPLRLFTASLVTFLLRMIGVGQISSAAVIMTENYATHIDLPCSGVKSIYFGLIILVVIFFLLKIRINWQSLVLAIAFFLLLMVFNIWRIFSLVYIYGVLNQIDLGDHVHLIFGVGGWLVSCCLLWWGASHLSKKRRSVAPKASRPKWFSPLAPRVFERLSREKSLYIVFGLLLGLGLVTLFLPPESSIATGNFNQISTKQFIFGENQQLVNLSKTEQTLFADPSIKLAIKTKFDWRAKNFDLLLVGSQTAKAYHDPETCLQAQGYYLTGSEPVEVISNLEELIKLRKLSISTHDGRQGFVYYWFISEDNKTLTDYVEKIWEQTKNKDGNWVMIELITEEKNDLAPTELVELFSELNWAVRQQLFTSD